MDKTIYRNWLKFMSSTRKRPTRPQFDRGRNLPSYPTRVQKKPTLTDGFSKQNVKKAANTQNAHGFLNYSEYIYPTQTATGAFLVKYQKYHQKLAVLYWEIVFIVKNLSTSCIVGISVRKKLAIPQVSSECN